MDLSLHKIDWLCDKLLVPFLKMSIGNTRSSLFFVGRNAVYDFDHKGKGHLWLFGEENSIVDGEGSRARSSLSAYNATTSKTQKKSFRTRPVICMRFIWVMRFRAKTMVSVEEMVF